MSADTKLKAYIDRVLHSREREDAEKANTKEIYAELAADGYDKTIVGKVVNHLRKDQDKAREQSEVFDLYLAAYLGSLHVHTRVREATSSQHRQSETTGAVPIKASAGANAGGENVAAPIAQDTEILEDVDGTRDGGLAPISAVEPGADALAAGHMPTWPLTPADDGRGVTHTASPPSEIAEPGTGGAGLPAAASGVPVDRTKPNPVCQDPEDCGVEASWNHVCGSCLRRRAQVEAAGAVQ